VQVHLRAAFLVDNIRICRSEVSSTHILSLICQDPKELKEPAVWAHTLASCLFVNHCKPGDTTVRSKLSLGGCVDRGLGDRVVGFMKRVNVLANNPDRQVVDVTDDRGVRSIMAVVYTGDVVLTAAESGGISIQTDTPLLLSVTLGDKQVGLSFSRPSTVASSTTLTVNGLPVGLKTDPGSASTCDSEGFIKLQFPSAQGRSAIGSCSV
jgi:hypothetical protein